MKKIPSLFKRNYDGDRNVYNEVVEGSEWVIEGEGVATVKMDGTAAMFKDGKMFKRYDCKKGKEPPDGFDPCEPERNEHTGHWPGWVPVGDGPDDKWFREIKPGIYDGTYELCGPKINGNPYKMKEHVVYKHGMVELIDFPREFSEIRIFFLENHIEGVVWHHPDGRMVKIKKMDFGLKWP